MTKKRDSLVGEGKEFPTDWHREAYEEGLAREVQGYLNRMAELESIGAGDSKAYADALSGLEAARGQLKRLGVGQETAEKRPAAKTREKRA